MAGKWLCFARWCLCRRRQAAQAAYGAACKHTTMKSNALLRSFLKKH